MELNLDDTTLNRLRFEQRTNRDKRVYVKVTTLLMLHKGVPVSDIEDFLGVDSSTLYRYVLSYHAKGLSDYLKDNWVPYDGRLSAEQESKLQMEVSSHWYTTAKQVRGWIKESFGIEYKSNISHLLGRLGFVYKKPKHVPGFTDIEAQQRFLSEFDAIVTQNAENQVIYFNDGVHPMHNTKPAYGWIRSGDEYPLPANTGRARLNISGALNAFDVTDVLVVERPCVNAQSSIEVWEKAQQRHPGKQIIHICDNARYYRCREIKEWLDKNPRTQVKFLPPYAPNLNLIERLWKFLRKEVINSNYYAKFSEFKTAVLGFFYNIEQYKSALETLLTLRFHLPKME